MPKRVATPPPGDDEPKYFTVVHPYPLHAHMELPQDRADFGRWIACCIGSNPFYAFFYKPSALNMVIVEVQREFDGIDRLLGEHRWKDFLKNPSEEEMGKVTKVFFCVYNTGRLVQKNGWRRVDAQESWFRNWSPMNNIINYPYPKTHYCHLVSEDMTNHPLCRPLPVSIFPQPPSQATAAAIVKTAPRPAPPGSAGWATGKSTLRKGKAWSKGLPTSLEIPAEPKFRGGKGPNSGREGVSPAKANSKDGPRINSSSPWSQTSTSPLSSRVGSAASPNPWNQGSISSTSSGPESVISPTSSRSNIYPSGGESNFSTVQTLTSAPAVPPGLDPIIHGSPADPPPPLSWDDIASGIPDPSKPLSWADDVPPGLFPDVVIHNAPSTLPPIFSSGLQSPEVPDNLEDAFADLGLDSEVDCPAKWEYTDNSHKNGSEDYVSESLWNDYEEETPVVEELCIDHGRICKRGICKTYAKQLKTAEKAKKEAGKAKKEVEKAAQKAEKAEKAAEKAVGASRGRGWKKGHGSVRDENGSDWRSDGKNEAPKPPRKRLAAPVGWNSGPNDSGTPIKASFGDEDEGSSKRSHSRAGSIESNPPSPIDNGWGPIGDPWGPVGASW